jgi:uncharacterized protein
LSELSLAETKNKLYNLSIIFILNARGVEFEFDDSKSQSNLAKHGINFLKAQELWSDPDRVEISARTEDEARFLIVGKIARQFWSAIITYRGNRVRIISVRRSRKEEVAIYESNRI